MVQVEVAGDCLEAKAARILGQLSSCCMHTLLQHLAVLRVSGESPLHRRGVLRRLVDGLVGVVRPICTTDA